MVVHVLNSWFIHHLVQENWLKFCLWKKYMFFNFMYLNILADQNQATMTHSLKIHKFTLDTWSAIDYILTLFWTELYKTNNCQITESSFYSVSKFMHFQTLVKIFIMFKMDAMEFRFVLFFLRLIPYVFLQKSWIFDDLFCRNVI